jgi:undecaprenyl-diphosphatase
VDYFQAILIGLVQGITELFPVSSLGHSVILPKLLGWTALVAAQRQPESFFLAFLVGLHVATALSLLVFYRARWAAIVTAVLRSATARRIDTPDARLGWLLIAATVPAGLLGLVFEHSLRTLFATPLVAAVLLMVNGLLLLAGERVRGRPVESVRSGRAPRAGPRSGLSLDRLGLRTAVGIGLAQAAALMPGISRSGITMVAGLVRGLDHEDAADFAFLLATPIILAAGLYKLPDLLGHNGDGVRGQVLVGSLVAGAAAYLSVRFLTRYFTAGTLVPFGLYCLVAGAVSVVLVR